MIGLGTLINTGSIIAGGIGGFLFGSRLKGSTRDTLTMACGVSTLFIGIAGAMEGMLSVAGGEIKSGGTTLVVICLVLGALTGELLGIEDAFERFGEWLKVKSGNAKDKEFVNAFVTASLTVCIGAMAIVGSIQDGILGDYSILLTKSILDLIIIMVMTAAMGKGCVFSAIPILIFEGGMTLLARLISPLMTDAAMFNLSMIGSVLIFCVGLNLIWGRKVKVANFLPALIYAAAWAFIGH